MPLIEESNSLASFYGTSKQHKSPVKFRYITSTVGAVTKPLCRILKNCLQMIQKQVIKACNTDDYMRNDNVRTCWIIDNNSEVIKRLFKVNRSGAVAKSVVSYDFDTL